MPSWEEKRQFSFLAVHYTYITTWILITSALLYVPGNLHYVDALLLASGAATQSGQNPVDLNRLHASQQLVLWAVAMVTNVIFVNSLLVLIRLSYFRKRLRSVVGQAKEARHVHSSGSLYGAIKRPTSLKIQHKDTDADPQPINHIAASSAGPRITFDEISQLQPYRHRRRSDSFDRAISSLPPFAWHASVASYSDWDETQKDELGGTEYRALKTLFFILLGYFVVFHVFGTVALFCVVFKHPQYRREIDTIGVSQTWWAVFTAGSAFNDVGFTLTPNSMASFNKAPLVLLVMTVLIVLGNTGFPCMLRLLIWTLSKIPNRASRRREELDFLLDHPRRCFTLLFPSADTWRLLGVLVVLNMVDLAIFLFLDMKPFHAQWHTWLINSLFQVASTRTAGFTVTSLTDLHPAVQVSFVVMMYISAFPTTMSMRKTNVYEEKSLGIYEDGGLSSSQISTASHPQQPNSKSRNLGYHIQKQLSFDVWYIALGTFLIALTEGDRLQTQQPPKQDTTTSPSSNSSEPGFALFAVLFEVVSAYGTVGLSLGYAWTESSLCAQFLGVSKLILLAMQIRGRHRGLPYALDHAVLLPYELCADTFTTTIGSEEGYEGDDEDDDEDGSGGGSGGGWKGWLRRRRSNLSSLLSVTDGEANGERLLP